MSCRRRSAKCAEPRTQREACPAGLSSHEVRIGFARCRPSSYSAGKPIRRLGDDAWRWEAIQFAYERAMEVIYGEHIRRSDCAERRFVQYG